MLFLQLKRNREALLRPQLRATPRLLRCLMLALSSGESAHAVAEQLLAVMECLLVEAAASANAVEVYLGVASDGVATVDIEALLR
jgi:hypothetical protein